MRPPSSERGGPVGPGAGFCAGAAPGHAEHDPPGRGIARGAGGFTWDEAAAEAWVICSAGSRKAAHVRAGSRAALCQVDGRRWLSVEGPGRTSTTIRRLSVRPNVRYAARYRPPRVNPSRVCLIVAAGRVLGSA